MQVYIKENNANVLDNMTQGTRMIYSKATPTREMLNKLKNENAII